MKSPSVDKMQSLLCKRAVEDRKKALNDIKHNFYRQLGLAGTCFDFDVQVRLTKNSDELTTVTLRSDRVLDALVEGILLNETPRLEEDTIVKFLKSFENFSEQLAYLEQHYGTE